MKKEIYENEKLLEIPGVYGKPIEGVKIMKLERIPDERGEVCHMLRSDDPVFEKFGEIYFSIAYAGAIKGWHLHKEMTLNYAVVSGLIKLVLFDERSGSATKGNLLEIFLGDSNYILVQVPPFVWNGFKCCGDKKAVVANCATLPHQKDEIERLDPFSSIIPYSWELKNG